MIFEFLPPNKSCVLDSSPHQLPALLNSPATVLRTSRCLLRQRLLRGPQMCPQLGTSSAWGPGRRGNQTTTQGTNSQSHDLVGLLPPQPGLGLHWAFSAALARNSQGCPLFHPLAQFGTLGLWTLGRGECHLLCCNWSPCFLLLPLTWRHQWSLILWQDGLTWLHQSPGSPSLWCTRPAHQS